MKSRTLVWKVSYPSEIPQQALRGVWYGHCSLEDIRPPSGEEVDYNKKVSAANTVVAMLIDWKRDHVRALNQHKPCRRVRVAREL